MKFKRISIQYGLAIISLLISAFGLAAVSANDELIVGGQFLNILGAFPAEVFSFNTFYIFGGSLALWVTIYNLIFYIPLIILQYYFKKTNWRIIFGIIPILILSYPMGFFVDEVFNKMTISQPVQIFFYSFGVVLSCIGFALFQASNIMNFPGNEVCEFISENTRYSFGVAKMVFDIASLILGVMILALNNILGNTQKIPGIGTLILMFFAGPLTGIILKFIKKNKIISSFRK